MPSSYHTCLAWITINLNKITTTHGKAFSNTCTVSKGSWKEFRGIFCETGQKGKKVSLDNWDLGALSPC
ncbi:hypothetical protein H5410_029329 [Solanum commersonii]|uniref:Uncharacterized protein n=1 Tax=Solanum commersonii TaxID=4109 RepID=A0A9J5Z6H5_SOLCO|nr:hypothetical protein H5410_029329 [Solanum commersonii]